MPKSHDGSASAEPLMLRSAWSAHVTRLPNLDVEVVRGIGRQLQPMLTQLGDPIVDKAHDALAASAPATSDCVTREP
jgi:hypothetical protein